MIPLISVIIPAYNSACFIEEALNSVFGQTYKSIEVIVVNDGSIDNTEDELLKFMDHIIYVKQENKGLAGARNTGIRHARGRLLAFLDADDKWFPEKLEAQQNFLANNQNIGLVHTNIFSWIPKSGEKYIVECGRNRFVGSCYRNLILENRVLPSTVLLRKECIDKVGLFDERLRSAEDWDLWIRISRYYSFGFINRPLVLYRIHDSSLSRNNQLMRECELRVLTKAIASDRKLSKIIGRKEINSKLYELNFGVGYGNFKNRKYSAAKINFKGAFRNKKEIIPLMYFLSCMLPVRLIWALTIIKKFLQKQL